MGPQQPHPWKFIWFMLCATAVSLDFWFFYIPVVNDDRKCISLDTKLAITACLLRFLFDFLYSFPIALQMLTDLVSTDYVSYEENDSYVTHTLRMIVDLVGGNNSRRNIYHKRVCEYLSPSLLVDLLAIFPLPQVMGILFKSNLKGLGMPVCTYIISTNSWTLKFVVLFPAGDFIHHSANERLENFGCNGLVEIFCLYPICAKDC